MVKGETEQMIISMDLNQQVEQALATYLANNGRGDCKRLEVLEVAERPFSAVVFYRAHTSGAPFDAVLKKVVHHPMNIALTSRENQAIVEYGILASLHPSFQGESGCFVPEPIALFADEEAYLMAYMPGQLLSEKFVAARYLAGSEAFRALKNWYRLCGHWLKKFQEVTAEKAAGVEIFATTRQRCLDKLELISAAHDRRCPADLKEQVMADLDRQLDKLAEEQVLTAGRHGDFGGWNILAHDQGITVFDFLGSQADSVAVDVLKMLVNLEDEKRYLAYSSRKVAELTKSFLDGYGPLPRIQQPVAIICETLHRVCSLCAAVVHTEGVGVRRRLEKHLCLQDHLSWLSADQKTLIWTECG